MKEWEPEFLAMVEEEWETWKGKGDEYTLGRDRLFNFTGAADKLGLTPRQIWAVYFWKHVCSVLNWAKTGDGGMEGIESRLLDICVYGKLGRLIARMESTPPPPNSIPLRLVPPVSSGSSFIDSIRRDMEKREPVDLTPQIFYREDALKTEGAEYVADAWQVPLTAGDRYDV